jgi:hypothetical protein
MKTKEEYDTLAYPFRAWTIWLLSALFMFYKYAFGGLPKRDDIDFNDGF